MHAPMFKDYLQNMYVCHFNLDSHCLNVYPGDSFSKTARKRKRENAELHEKLAQLQQAMIRMKRNEAAMDRLLSRYLKNEWGKNLSTIYCITPTYARLTQKAELTRLCQTIQHVWNFHWIVVEDSEVKTDLVSRFLKRCGVTYTHLTRRTSPHLRRTSKKAPWWQFPRGMEQRNEGLEWIRRNFDPKTMKGVVYFGDDDNTYDVEIFTKV